MKDQLRLCATCAARVTCARLGHDYVDHRRHPDGSNDSTGGWRVCACDRSIPSHGDTAADPAGGPGCGMAWRLCGRCDHIDERHITDTDTAAEIGERIEFQPGGHLRQDVPAGLGLPNHQMSSEENVMVGPNPAPGTAVPGAASQRGGQA